MKKNQSQDAPAKKRKGKDRAEESNWIRNSFVRLFGKYDFRDEKQFVFFAKWLLYALLILVEVLMLWKQLGNFGTKRGKITLFALIGFETMLTISEGLKLFVFKNGKKEIPFFIVNILAACGTLFVAEGAYPMIVFIVILSELYIGARKTSQSFLVFCLGVPIYALCYTAKRFTWAEVQLVDIFQDALGAFLALGAHFVVMHIALAFYRQFLRLDKALNELNESKKELEKAYAVVAEVTALEERQRIAKEIHDTAGHSITTVIMQTEAAKRILDENAQEAKNKIIAANLQAKHALEELRDSVHLLSGNTAEKTLQTALLDIIHESTDGTGIKIRSEIEDIVVSSAKYRFLCNTLKEGISNGLRHGGATAFWFELKREEGKIRFLLSDNGAGATDGVTLGFGLTTMRQRATALGGEVTFESIQDEGFELRLVLPADMEE